MFLLMVYELSLCEEKEGIPYFLTYVIKFDIIRVLLNYKLWFTKKAIIPAQWSCGLS